ncbi:oxygen-independent coproporphyrinogen III oxidase [Helicobacter cholecystus]|uniref:Coproporphyrinogen-III oxidase n=1 Tax=Helicobacter cholecystus TaxID=45498 RepID=A0A3D8IXS0_9HELI|nr:oxygen-independent coproporphyrinogen III oxidase [Helicobacter cholecystus]RDU69414.1 oxygen-independent coproporphyrinogen III oxidase [Helicobacter cholecystus]VEJ23962.1 coproporphyrinogen III oxidase [Helicobacter cholecystus]
MIDFEKIAKYSKAGPRYTSYPTANEFHSGFNPIDYQKALQQSNSSSLPLSLYVHLPFCRSACYFCGCNVIYTSKEENKAVYISYLKKELEILSKFLNTKREVIQLHFGGGTPTFFNADELKEVIALLRKFFPNFHTNAEISCEIDPRFFNSNQMQVLREGGFNRVSFGVQDFDAQVQKAIHRIQSVELVAEAVQIARRFGIHSINFDLIYGLPYQNLQTFQQTLQKVLTLSPDRLAIFNYAHVPWMKKTMRKIDETTLPSPKEKLKILEFMISFLSNHGYELIGMDHFAKKDDELYYAKENGELRRNFQGYTTKGFSQTVGIGLTSISEGVNFYAQNHKDLHEYQKALDEGILPTSKGIWLSDEDRLRKEVIMQIMNNLYLDFSKIQEQFGIDFKSYFNTALNALKPYKEAGLLEIGENHLKATPTGGMLIRNIAMEFDGFLAKAPIGENKFSKTL